MKCTGGTVNASIASFTFTYSTGEADALASAIAWTGTWNKRREQ